MIGPGGFMQAPKPSERPAYGTAMIRCGRAKCKWRGFEGDLERVPHKRITGMGLTAMACPTCGCDSYMFMTPGEVKAWQRKQGATA